ncbi:MAG: DegT/DnrJ/EryC1/StrS family aminotransferase [Clostridiales bacterium]|jgi:dTDP-4-amino-4,6-dideoxygalactose transaminase|nr:DegT/DnrJ/EryC1/StrS family aminotransferase [Clostridiales bacterium]
MEKLAILGGPKTVTASPEDVTELLRWPIITKEAEDDALAVLRAGSMSDTDITCQFENEFAAWQGLRHAIGYCNGTMALQAAMFACGLGSGDELICPSLTYWASAAQVFSLGGTVVFADVEPRSLCIDPEALERCISPRTKAIMVVHYMSHPADMDAIMAVARKHGLLVIEDVSHAQGGLYKGRKLGTIGHVAAMSLMSGKSFAIGEGGILATDDRTLYDRAIAFAHYERNKPDIIQTAELLPYTGLPLGGVKGRMHQVSAAVGRSQLRLYDSRTAEIRKAMNYFWDLLKDVPGVRAHRVDEASGSNMAGWYRPLGFYEQQEAAGLSVYRFCEALNAEGVGVGPGCNTPLHTHPMFSEMDIYRHGKPTRVALASRDVRELDKYLPETERANARCYSVPWFKHYQPELIQQFAQAFIKVSLNYDALLAGDLPQARQAGRWYFYKGKNEK